MYTYNILQKELLEKVQLPQRVVFAVCAGNSALLTEMDDDSYLEKAGSMGIIEDGVYSEKLKIPFISASNIIRTCVYNGKGFYLSSNKAGYFWDINKNIVYVYDFNQISNLDGGVCVTEHGFKCLIKIDDRYYVRTISINN